MSDDKTIQLSTRLQITRREALQLFGAGVAAIQAGCFERPGEEIRPAVRRPEVSPGTPQLYATSMVIDGYATGLLVESHAGRPTKIEGNPAHPASLGATLAQHQASILDLYDPHRLRAPHAAGQPASWDRVRGVLAQLPPGELWLVLPPDGSPTIAATLDRVRKRFPHVNVVQHSLLSRQQAHRGTELAFGQPLDPQLAFDRAEVVVSLDADFLASSPMAVRWSRDFSKRRRAVEQGETPVRLFVAEPMLTPTGSLADHRLSIRAGDVAAVGILLAAALVRRGVASLDLPASLVQMAELRVPDRSWIELAATSLVRARGASVLVAGDRQPAAVQALVHRLALSLGSIGRTTVYSQPVVMHDGRTLAELANALRSGRASCVLCLETDPVHDAPAYLELPLLVRRAPVSMTLASHACATSDASGWALPSSHYLESWGDARAYDGTASPIQPLIRPLHDTRSRLEVLALLAGDHAPDDRELVRTTWRDASWEAALGEGVFPNTQSPAVAVQARGDAEIVDALAALLQSVEGIEIDLAPSPSVVDGRFANNPWLQELPHPITKLTWSNAAMMSSATARALGAKDGDVVRIAAAGYHVDVPAVVALGHADGCISVELGYGQASRAAPISNGVGGNAAVIGGPIVRGATVTRTGRHSALARSQQELDQHHRDIALHTDLASYRREPDFTASHRGELPTLLDPPERSPEIPQWAMTIDTTICTGCSSCVVACQAENNVPTVGAEGVRRGREMHWLRIDTYAEQTTEGVEVVHQPMLCQHCEHAPCEYVCPVFATAHSPDGLNEMTYNRCVGTRFCSNNCPYKVRRFNWFAYDKPVTLRSLQYNPDVTVRARGVMEKCTFCVQRIRGAEVRSRMEKRPIASGEVVTACQQACPTGAIQFAALQHTDTAMVKWRAAKRLYGALHELGTRPRVMYLAKIRNPEAGE